ncbi:MAG TPA: CRISPR-associated helicase/endonuclease Cas3, partial [Pseudogracilibacillus sp.]|nr:CRISPR-associated helicase/endonuclease Cas3 [Pseudogracilibacillus sp.]
SSFKTLEKHFEAISSPTTAVLVPYDNVAKDMIAQLNEDIPLEKLNKVLKKAQGYAVNVFEYEKMLLEKEDLLYPLMKEGIFAVRDEAYHEKYGISFEGAGKKGDLLF